MPQQYRSPHAHVVPVVRHRLSVAARILAGAGMLGALAAMFVPSDPDPLVVIYLAAPSLLLALVSNHLDGRKLLTGDPRTVPGEPPG